MDVQGLQIDPQQLIEMAAVFGGLTVAGVVGVLFVRRARATRLRQIEGSGVEAAAPSPRRMAPAEAEPDDDPESATATEPTKPDRSAPGLASVSAVPTAAERAPAANRLPEASARAALAVPQDKPRPAPARVIVPTPTPPPARGSAGQVIPFHKPTPEVARPAIVYPPVRPDDAIDVEPQPRDKPKKDGSALAPGLARTRSGWISRLGDLFTGKREIDPALLDEVEKVLLTADIGVRTSQKFLEEMRAALSRKELKDPAAAWAYLRQRTTEVLSFDVAPVDWTSGHPFVLLVIGVNGSGKTTTIGKLAAQLVAQGKKVIVGAGDTFRAAAAEQLAIWSDRVGATLVRGKEGADPSSVLFDAVKRARAEGFDVVIADTAGRLHTKTDLMEELQKIRRVIGKASDGAPHETWLVIDSTSGQNAIAQAQIFTQAMAVSGIVLTKLDGTAKGGVILGIADQLRIPVRFVGIGERVEDLRQFDAEEFVEALYQ